MGDISSDTEAELYMMIEAYKRLRAVNPNHPLLRFVKLDSDKGGVVFSPGFRRRFHRKGDEWIVHSYGRYHSALETAYNESARTVPVVS